MREGGKAAAGGCSEKFIYGTPLYCHLLLRRRTGTTTTKKEGDDG